MFRALTRPVGTDVELKARCSTGLTVTEYIGGQMSASTASMQYSALDSDKVLTFILRNDDKLKDDSLVFF